MNDDSELFELELERRKRLIDPEIQCESDFIIAYTSLFITTHLGGLKKGCQFVLRDKQCPNWDVTAVLPPVGNRFNLLNVDYFINWHSRPVDPLAAGLTLCRAHLTELSQHDPEVQKVRLQQILEPIKLEELAPAILKHLQDAAFDASTLDDEIATLSVPLGDDIFDELKPILAEKPNNRVQLLFCLNRSQSHWLTSEIQLVKTDGNIDVRIIFHDPYSRSVVADDQNAYDTLVKSIKLRLNEIGPYTVNNITTHVTTFFPRQFWSDNEEEHDNTSCGFIASHDMMRLVRNNNLSLPQPYPRGCLALRKEMLSFVIARSTESNRGKWIAEYTSESAPVENTRIEKIIALINQVRNHDCSDMSQRSVLNSLLFRISWLCAELPRQSKFSDDSKFSKIGTRNWIMLDYLSIALKDALDDPSKLWISDEYSEIIASLCDFQRHLVKLNTQKDYKLDPPEYEYFDKNIGNRLDSYCFGVSYAGINEALAPTSDQEDEIYAILRVFSIIGESSKIFSPKACESIEKSTSADLELLKKLRNLRDCCIHFKSRMHLLLSYNIELRAKIVTILLPFLKDLFSTPPCVNLNTLNDACSILSEFIDCSEARMLLPKEDIEKYIELLKPDAQVRFRRWSGCYAKDFPSMEDFVLWMNENQADGLPLAQELTKNNLEDLYYRSQGRTLSYQKVKVILDDIVDTNIKDGTPTQLKMRLKDYFKKDTVTIADKNKALEDLNLLCLIPPSQRRQLNYFIKIKANQSSLTGDDKYDSCREIILKHIITAGKSNHQVYREFQAFVRVVNSEYGRCIGKKSEEVSLIDWKLFMELFPNQFQGLIESFIDSASDLTSSEVMKDLISSEDKQILKRMFNVDEFKDDVCSYLRSVGVSDKDVLDTYAKIDSLRQLDEKEVQDAVRALVKETISLIDITTIAECNNKESKMVENELNSVTLLTGSRISSQEAETLMQKMCQRKHIKDDRIIEETSKRLVGADKKTCEDTLKRAIIKEKASRQYHSRLVVFAHTQRSTISASFEDLMGRVATVDGGSVIKKYKADLSTIVVPAKTVKKVVEKNKKTLGHKIGKLTDRCEALATIFFKIRSEADFLKRGKLVLVAEYLIEDIGDKSGWLASDQDFSETDYFEISKRNLFMITFIRKCIAHFPLKLSRDKFNFLMELFSIHVPDRLKTYLTLSQADFWHRIYQPSRRVDISEFRENTDMYLEFQMLVEQCGFRPIVKVVTEPIGIMGDMTILVEPNPTNSHAAWDLFELEISVGHLLNADMAMGTTDSFRVRGESRVPADVFERLVNAKPLAELIMKDTVASLLHAGSYSKLGRIGRSDFSFIDTMVRLVQMIRPETEATIDSLLALLNDEEALKHSVNTFLSEIKRTNNWRKLKEWRGFFVDYILLPQMFGHKPVAVRLANETLVPIPFVNDDHAFEFFQHSPSDTGVQPDDVVAKSYIRLDEHFWVRADHAFANIHITIQNHALNTERVQSIIQYICFCLQMQAPTIRMLAEKIKAIESAPMVDRVRDQAFLEDHYRKIRQGRMKRLESRDDVRTVIKSRARQCVQKLSNIVRSTRSSFDTAQWNMLTDLLVRCVKNNEALDRYYCQHEAELTRVFQSMDDSEAEMYGALISKPELCMYKYHTHHVRSKYTFRLIARHDTKRFTFSSELEESLRVESDMQKYVQRDGKLFIEYSRLVAIFNNFSSSSALLALLDPTSTNEMKLIEFEKLLSDNYADETELPLTFLFSDGSIQFSPFCSEIEQEATTQREELVCSVKRIASLQGLPQLLTRILEEDITVFTDPNLIPSSTSCRIDLPEVFNGIVGYPSELDGQLKHVHIAIACHYLQMMMPAQITRCDLIDFLSEYYDCTHDYNVTRHGTMAFYEWKIRSINDLLKLHEWDAEEILSYQSRPEYKDHEKIISEYYQFREIHDIIGSYQERAVAYSKRIKKYVQIIRNLSGFGNISSSKVQVAYLGDKIDELVTAYRSNRTAIQNYMEQLFETDFVKLRILKLLKMPTVIVPFVTQILECKANRDNITMELISQLMSSARESVYKEVCHNTNFSVESEQDFDLWLQKHLPKVSSAAPALPQANNRFRFLPNLKINSDTVVLLDQETHRYH